MRPRWSIRVRDGLVMLLDLADDNHPRNMHPREAARLLAAKRWVAGMICWYDRRAYRGRQHLEGV